MRYLIDQQHASVYWNDEGTLMFAPLRIDNTFDTDEGGEVDFAQLSDKDRADLEKMREHLS
jgi:hypothetical protein